jgi:hypothetical protein
MLKIKDWLTEDSNKMFYDINEKKDTKRTYEKYNEYAHDLSFENDSNKDD